MKPKLVVAILVACIFSMSLVTLAAPVKEITVMIAIPATQPQILEDVVTKFEKAYPDVKVNLINGADAKVLTSIAGGLIPDVATISNVMAPSFYKSGAAMDLTPFIQADKFDVMQIPPNYESLMWKGHWYGMPQAGGAFADRAIYYNKDLLNAAGMAMPTFQWTWNTFATYMQKLTVDKQNDGVNEQVGFTFSNLEWPIWVWSGGGDIFNEARTEFTLTNQAAVNALEFWAGLTRKKQVGYPNGDFANGKTAMRTGAYFETRTLSDKVLSFDWSVVEFPKGPAGSVNRRASHPWVVPTGAKYPKEGWQFIKFWLSDEVQSDLVLKWNWRPPVTASIAKQLARMKFDKAPYTYVPFMGINSTSKPLPVDVPNWDQITVALDQALVPVWKGEQSALAAMSAIAPQVMSLAK